MNLGRQTKLVRENNFVAEVEVEFIASDDPWAPYLSIEDAQRLDAVRIALRSGDIAEALRHGRVYRLVPLERAS